MIFYPEELRIFAINRLLKKESITVEDLYIFDRRYKKERRTNVERRTSFFAMLNDEKRKHNRRNYDRRKN